MRDDTPLVIIETPGCAGKDGTRCRRMRRLGGTVCTAPEGELPRIDRYGFAGAAAQLGGRTSSMTCGAAR